MVPQENLTNYWEFPVRDCGHTQKVIKHSRLSHMMVEVLQEEAYRLERLNLL